MLKFYKKRKNILILHIIERSHRYRKLHNKKVKTTSLTFATITNVEMLELIINISVNNNKNEIHIMFKSLELQ